MSTVNLDALAARAAELMREAIGKDCMQGSTRAKVTAEKADTVFTKALGIVQESGTYAGTVYLLYQSGDKANLDEATMEQRLCCQTLAALVRLLGEPRLGNLSLGYAGGMEPAEVNGHKTAIRKHMAQVSERGLEEIFLVKQLWELALTYARYIARGMKKAGAET